MGAAWKAMPADLSQPRLGKRVLDLMDDMNNWGLKKHVIGEADLFSIEPENEMYAHLNVNYLQLDNLPGFNNGWQPVLDAMQQGKFFTTTGEVLLPVFKVNGKASNQTVELDPSGKAQIELEVQWLFDSITFKLNTKSSEGSGNTNSDEKKTVFIFLVLCHNMVQK